MNSEVTDRASQPEARAWQVRPFAPGDETRIAQLYRTVFDRALPLDQYRWKLVNVPWQTGAPGIWLADAGDRLAGHYGGTPIRFKLGRQQLLTVHTCNAMTDATFRRQGVFSALGTTAHRAWTEAGVPFLIGLPNDQWGTRRKFLGYQEQFKATWYWRPLRPERLLADRYRLPPAAWRPVAALGRLWNAVWDRPLARAAGGIQVEAVDRPGPEFDRLWAALADAYEALVVRDRAWVTYRYADAPRYGYRLLLAKRDGDPAGYLAYRLGQAGAQPMGWIVDIFTGPDDWPARAALLQATLRAMLAAGATSIRTMLPEGTSLVDVFRRAGFRRSRGEFDVSVVPLATDRPPPALTDPERWFTMIGDYDIV